MGERRRFVSWCIGVVAISLAAGAFLMYAPGETPLYMLIAGFYFGPIVSLLFVFGGVEAAPRWTWFVVYFGGVLVQNAVLAFLVVWLRRKLTSRSSRRPAGAAHL
jgi:hypothetical protein